QSVIAEIPVILFCIMFSLSMDYEVFIISSIHEHYMSGSNNTDAIIKGISDTGATITKAALVMLIVFGAFIQADIIIIQMTGLGLAMAVFLDATLIRMIILPVFMKIAGKANWYSP